MKVVYFGSGRFGIECLNAVLRSTHRLVHIFTQSPQPAGRGRVPTPMPAAAWARQHSIPCTETEDINTHEIMDKVSRCLPDIIVVAAFGQKIGEELINLPPKGMINVHGSLLPKYRGAAPINWAIINGESESGVTIVTVAPEIDTGQMLAQARAPILAVDTAQSLHDKLALLAAPLLIRTLSDIEGGSAIYQAQDPAQVSLAPRLKKSDGHIEWHKPAEVIRNRIHGLWPWPGAQSTYVSGKTQKSCRVTIAQAEVIETKPDKFAGAGTVDENLNVTCGRDALKILKIKPENHRLMDFRDFVNGRGTAPGDMFVKTEE